MFGFGTFAQLAFMQFPVLPPLPFLVFQRQTLFIPLLTSVTIKVS